MTEIKAYCVECEINHSTNEMLSIEADITNGNLIITYECSVCNKKFKVSMIEKENES